MAIPAAASAGFTEPVCDGRLQCPAELEDALSGPDVGKEMGGREVPVALKAQCPETFLTKVGQPDIAHLTLAIEGLAERSVEKGGASEAKRTPI
jgi:hypothetical protein